MANGPIRYAFYLPHLRTGGVERVMVNLANHFARRGEAPLFILDRGGGALVEALAPEVKVQPLDAARTLAALPRLARALRAHRPRVLLSAITHNSPVAILAAALARSRTRVAVAEHTVLSQELAERAPRERRLLPKLLQVAYRRAAAILCPSAAIAEDLSRLCLIPRERIEVLDNPVLPEDVAARAAVPLDDPWLAPGPALFVAAGRLAPVKDFAALLRAFARIAAQRPARLLILGDGPLRDALLAQAAALGVADRVRLPGAVPDPLPYFARAACVVSTSRYEGFGNVLVEALAVGTPVVSTDCPGGPRSILADGRLGRLVPLADDEGLAEAMLAALDERPPKEMLQESVRRYRVDLAGDAYLRRLAAL